MTREHTPTVTSRRRRALGRWLIPAGLAFAGGLWWLSSALGGNAEIAWAAAQRGDLVIGVEVEGTLGSRDSSILSPPLAEGIFDFKIRYMAPEGTEVEEGAPVLGFDTSVLDRRLLTLQNEAEKAGKNIEKLDADQAQKAMNLELRLAEAEAKLAKAELKNQMPEDLRSAAAARKTRLDLGLAGMEVESLRGQLDAARTVGESQRAALVAQKQRAERLVRKTQATIEQMMVKAPRQGTVIYVTNWRGDKKKVGDSAWQYEKIVELPNLNSMMAKAEVDEADAGRLRIGQAVSLRLDAHPDIEYTATVESIWRTVQRKRSSRNPLKIVRLDLELGETDTERMRPGMRFRGTLEAERVAGALLIPIQAVFPTATGPVVFRRALLGYERVPVVLGRRNSEVVQVLEGLAVGDLVAENDPRA